MSATFLLPPLTPMATLRADAEHDPLRELATPPGAGGIVTGPPHTVARLSPYGARRGVSDSSARLGRRARHRGDVGPRIGDVLDSPCIRVPPQRTGSRGSPGDPRHVQGPPAPLAAPRCTPGEASRLVEEHAASGIRLTRMARRAALPLLAAAALASSCCSWAAEDHRVVRHLPQLHATRARRRLS